MFNKKEEVLVQTQLGTLTASFNGSEEYPGVVIELRREGKEDELITEVEYRGEENTLTVDVWEHLGDVEPSQTHEVEVEIPEEERPVLVSKADVLKILHEIGGCGAQDPYFQGWDKAIDGAYEAIKELKGAK
ncbi:MAG: hypothetical protein R3Y55_03790 [Rikenellaceae bacterium]